MNKLSRIFLSIASIILLIFTIYFSIQIYNYELQAKKINEERILFHFQPTTSEPFFQEITTLIKIPGSGKFEYKVYSDYRADECVDLSLQVEINIIINKSFVDQFTVSEIEPKAVVCVEEQNSINVEKWWRSNDMINGTTKFNITSSSNYKYWHVYILYNSPAIQAQLDRLDSNKLISLIITLIFALSTFFTLILSIKKKIEKKDNSESKFTNNNGQE